MLLSTSHFKQKPFHDSDILSILSHSMPKHLRWPALTDSLDTLHRILAWLYLDHSPTLTSTHPSLQSWPWGGFGVLNNNLTATSQPPMSLLLSLLTLTPDSCTDWIFSQHLSSLRQHWELGYKVHASHILQKLNLKKRKEEKLQAVHSGHLSLRINLQFFQKITTSVTERDVTGSPG